MRSAPSAPARHTQCDYRRHCAQSAVVTVMRHRPSTNTRLTEAHVCLFVVHGINVLCDPLPARPLRIPSAGKVTRAPCCSTRCMVANFAASGVPKYPPRRLFPSPCRTAPPPPPSYEFGIYCSVPNVVMQWGGLPGCVPQSTANISAWLLRDALCVTHAEIYCAPNLCSCGRAHRTPLSQARRASGPYYFWARPSPGQRGRGRLAV